MYVLSVLYLRYRNVFRELYGYKTKVDTCVVSNVKITIDRRDSSRGCFSSPWSDRQWAIVAIPGHTP